MLRYIFQCKIIKTVVNCDARRSIFAMQNYVRFPFVARPACCFTNHNHVFCILSTVWNQPFPREILESSTIIYRCNVFQPWVTKYIDVDSKKKPKGQFVIFNRRKFANNYLVKNVFELDKNYKDTFFYLVYFE